MALEETLDRKLGLAVESGRISTMEVLMRPPSVFVRPLLHEEAVRLKRLSRRAKHESTRQRAAVLLASNVRMPVPKIAEMWRTDSSWVRKVIHEFNERGLESLRPRYRGGRPRRITSDERKRIVAVAGARPDAQGIPLTRWSLPRLSAQLVREGIEVSPRHLGTLLAEAGLSFQRTRTWKASPDSEYERKAARILELCDAPPGDGSVVSFDQMGPISLRPSAGAGWAPKGRPERQRADYNRRFGIRYVFGAYDVHADRLRVRLRPRRAGADMLAFMRQIRLAYPARRRIYWIQDNLSANWVPPIRTFAAANRIELVATPTYASYLNPVECHFSALTEFVVANADYLDWDAFGYALAEHIRYRNTDHRDLRIAAAEAKHRIAA
ncbi:MAG: IS630 family transposase [Gaiellaceae bacterium]